MKAQIHQPLPLANISDKTIRNVIAKATAKIQSERYQNAESLMAAINADIPSEVVEEPVVTNTLKKVDGTIAMILGGILGVAIGIGIYFLVNQL